MSTKKDDVLLTCLTLIELLEYVRRKRALESSTASLVDEPFGTDAVLPAREVRVIRRDPCVAVPRMDAEEDVSSELSLSPDAVGCESGTGGTNSAGARNPFLICGVAVAEVARFPGTLNKFLAFGADATRRMKRVAALGFLVPGTPSGFDPIPAL